MGMHDHTAQSARQKRVGHGYQTFYKLKQTIEPVSENINAELCKQNEKAGQRSEDKDVVCELIMASGDR